MVDKEPHLLETTGEIKMFVESKPIIYMNSVFIESRKVSFTNLIEL